MQTRTIDVTFIARSVHKPIFCVVALHAESSDVNLKQQKSGHQDGPVVTRRGVIKVLLTATARSQWTNGIQQTATARMDQRDSVISNGKIPMDCLQQRPDPSGSLRLHQPQRQDPNGAVRLWEPCDSGLAAAAYRSWVVGVGDAADTFFAKPSPRRSTSDLLSRNDEHQTKCAAGLRDQSPRIEILNTSVGTHASEAALQRRQGLCSPKWMKEHIPRHEARLMDDVQPSDSKLGTNVSRTHGPNAVDLMSTTS